MAIQSGFGRVSVFEDFMGYNATATISDATAGTRWNDLTFAAVSGDAVVIGTLDETCGVASFSGAAGAGDGMAIYSSPFQPSAMGPITMEARFKGGSATDMRIFVGWQETVALDEPVNPFTLSSTTLTSNDGGNVFGFYADTQATTDDFRLHASLDGVELTTAGVYVGAGSPSSTSTTLGALGIRAGVTFTADSWYVARVVINPDGTGEGYFGHTTMAGALGPRLIGRLTNAGTLDQTALYYPIILLLAQSTGDPLLELDYFGAVGHRDWAA